MVRRKKRLSGGSAPASKDASGGKWLPEEDDRLRAGVEQLGAKNWKRISEEYLDKKRTDVQCLHRWQKVRVLLWGECQGGRRVCGCCVCRFLCASIVMVA